jgi:uncharacterized protein YodC (DUF2158 family)
MTIITGRRASIATALAFGIALGIPFSAPATSEPAPSSVATPDQAAIPLKRGDLVRLRSGGILMTVASVKGDQVDCFWTDLNDEPNAETFPIAVLQKF